MAGTLVIGFGNPLRRDDALGPHAIRALSEIRPALAADLIEVHQLGPELAEQVAASSLVLFLDADAEGEPGEIRVSPVPPEASVPALPNHMTPAGLLAVAEQLYGRRPEAKTLTITAGSLDFGETFTPEVSASLPAYLARVAGMIPAVRSQDQTG